MKIIADLHIHSKYSRACSRDLNIKNLSLWADKKGINILGTGDFTHPQWLASLKESLVESEPGLYRVKDSQSKVCFVLSTELASIYKQGDKVRRVHNLVYAPSFASVDKFIKLLETRKVNLKSDGRPIMGVSCVDLIKICKEAHDSMELVPAHIWTPHFGVLGSLTGFDSLQECYGDMTKHILAVETGLSSNPEMNWKVAELSNISLVSNSDAHSLRKLGREANVFEIKEKALSYAEIMRVIHEHKPTEFVETIEFFPEEGKYHLDGHADCSFSCLPEQTKQLGGICPICGKKLLRGVMHRVSDLSLISNTKTKSDTAHPYLIPFRSIIPLEEIIAETFGVGTASKKVQTQYEAMVAEISEFDLLLNTNQLTLERLSSKEIAESVMRVRNGQVHITGGYDGVFGKIQIYSQQEREIIKLKPKR